MSSLDVDRELASLSIPQLIERLSRLTENYSAAVERITITKTKGNWGKLKSGKGWICLKYAAIL